MEQFKELISEPAKLEALYKETWIKIDTKGEGSVTYDQYATQADAILNPSECQKRNHQAKKI